MRRSNKSFVVAAAAVWPCFTCSAQSLLRDAQEPVPLATEDGAQPALEETSLVYIEPPEKRTYEKHDLITIVIDEVSSQTADHKLETKKQYDFTAALQKFPSLKALIDGELKTGDSNPVVETGVTGDQNFKGEGKYDRSDRFKARIQAEVIDVKPNGTMVLEARKTITKDEEISTIVLSGVVRSEDVTTQNTVLSSQLADLIVSSTNEGEVKDANEKGLIPRFFEAIFNF